MSSDFDLNIAPGSGNQNSLLSVQNLTLTVPPASQGTNFTIVVSSGTNVTIGAVTPPSGLTWSANTLTVGSSFSGSATVTIPFTASGWNPDSSPSTTLTITQSGTSAAGSQTTLTLNSDGSFGVSPGAGVTYQGVFSYLTGIPADCEVRLTSPVFFVPQVTGTPNFTFSITGNTGVTVSGVTVPPSSVLSVSGSSPYTVTVSSPPGASGVTVTVTYATSLTTTFTVLPSSASVTAGAQSSLQVNSDGSFMLTQLASGVQAAGCNNTYETTGGADFDCTGFGVTFPNGAQSVTFGSGAPSITPSYSNGVLSFEDPENKTGNPQQFTFAVATNAGTLDPTILNQPDSSPNPPRVA